MEDPVTSETPGREAALRQRRKDLPARQIAPIRRDAVPVMEAVNLSKAFGATTALVDVSLKAYAGRILALLGDNGAGKSTLIKILSGVFPPDRGELRFRGEPRGLRRPRRRRARAASPRCSRTSPSASCCRSPATSCSAASRRRASGRSSCST